MAVGSRPQGDTLILETDNGDNGALELAAVALSRPVFQLLFMTRDTRPVYIYYGNPQAQPPRYDLSLVEAEIHAVTPTHVHLENEEVLKPVRTAVEDSGKGSPWLWAMLALVVGGLLWLVAKLLPKQEV